MSNNEIMISPNKDLVAVEEAEQECVNEEILAQAQPEEVVSLSLRKALRLVDTYYDKYATFKISRAELKVNLNRVAANLRNTNGSTKEDAQSLLTFIKKNESTIEQRRAEFVKKERANAFDDLGSLINGL